MASCYIMQETIDDSPHVVGVGRSREESSQCNLPKQLGRQSMGSGLNSQRCYNDKNEGHGLERPARPS